MHVRLKRRVGLLAIIVIVACVFAVAVSPRTPSGVVIGVLSGVAIAFPLGILDILLNGALADRAHCLPVAVMLLVGVCAHHVLRTGVCYCSSRGQHVSLRDMAAAS